MVCWNFLCRSTVRLVLQSQASLVAAAPFIRSNAVLIRNFSRSETKNYCSSSSSSSTPTNMGCSTSKVQVSRSATNNEKKADSAQNEDSSGQDSAQDDYVEGIVCQDSDIKENEMKTFELEDAGKVLLVRQNGKLSALGTKCTHYGAPLVNGVLGQGRVRCQWHGACFNIMNGDIEDYPGLDSLPCYQVTVENNSVKVRAKRAHLETNKRLKPMTRRDQREAQNIVVIGGGPSGATCVETLRQEGFQGRIALVCKENYLPYDRVKVSKAMDFEIEKAQFRTDEFYKEKDIDVFKGVEATAVDSSKKTVTLSNGKSLEYDRLYIATGLRADKTKVPGADLQNVVVLRDYDHSKYTNAQLTEDKEVVVLGSSFIAMEAANYCLNKVKKVTVIFRGDLPFKPFLGPKIGAACLKLYQDKGVHFVQNSGITKCIEDAGNPGKVGKVELKDGTLLDAHLVIMGVGGSCYTDFLKDSGIEVRPDGTIEVDDHLQTATQGVFAGGDIAYAPVWSHGNAKAAIGHYPLAHYHGKMAALNMLGKRTSMQAVPYFWTMLFGKGIRYSGHGKFDDVIYHGNVEDLKFVAFYLDKDEVVATSSCGMDPVVSQFAELLAQGKKLHRNDLVEGGDALAWTKRLVASA